MKVMGLCLLLMVLTGCQSLAPPKNAGNLCAVFSEKRHWQEPAAASEQRWSISAPVLMATMYHESSYRHDAKPPKRYLLGFIPWGRVSDAHGYAQATDSTWEVYVKKENRWFASRERFADAIDFIGWYHRGSVNELGISPQDSRQLYLAYHEGRGGYRRKSFNHKPWLLRYSDRVAETSQRYRQQLASCSAWRP